MSATSAVSAASAAAAAKLDREDPLRGFRAQFVAPADEPIYLDGTRSAACPRRRSRD